MPTTVPTTVHVDRALCLGTGLCEAMRPDSFALTDDGFAVTMHGEVTDADVVRRLRDIADCCPSGAITLRPAETAIESIKD